MHFHIITIFILKKILKFAESEGWKTVIKYGGQLWAKCTFFCLCHHNTRQFFQLLVTIYEKCKDHRFWPFGIFFFADFGWSLNSLGWVLKISNQNRKRFINLKVVLEQHLSLIQLFKQLQLIISFWRENWTLWKKWKVAPNRWQFWGLEQ